MVAKVPIRQPEHQPVAEGIELLHRSRLGNACAAATGFAEGRHRDRSGTCEGGGRRRREINQNLFKFHVDFTTPSNSTFTGPTALPVASFSEACGRGTCIPQPGTMQQLDSLGDRLMFRLAYRNFGDHESLVVNHSVTAGSSVGVRWYEIRSPNATPTVFQQGTFSPDSQYRWMGSIAMDQSGDIAVGYSASSSSNFPA